jgi:enoyl-CoA hydratase/carnithine racemase
VNQVVPVADLDDVVDVLAADLASKSPLVMRWGRDSFYRAQGMTSDDALAYLQGMLTVTVSSDDAAEGISAFVEKRPPRWQGR